MSEQNQELQPRIDSSNAPYQSVWVIINPAAGQDRPILGTLNKAFHEAGIDWDVRLTKKSGDAFRFAREAVEAGISAVAVYGGDGTVTEVASGLQNTNVPLAIFPGGTANVVSVELGIPTDLAAAAALVCGQNSDVRTIDMGRCGDRDFLLRVGIGFEADMINQADRETKNRIGSLAYVLSALQTIPARKVARYRLTLDGEEVEAEGVSCMIANSANLGLPGLNLARNIDVSDGLLDALLIRDTDIGGLLQVAASAVGITDSLQHWQARQIRVEVDPPQSVICDGEPFDDMPLTVEVVPQALRVLVPKVAVTGEGVDQAGP